MMAIINSENSVTTVDLREKTATGINRLFSKENCQGVVQSTCNIVKIFREYGEKAADAIDIKTLTSSEIVKSMAKIGGSVANIFINIIGIGITLSAFLGEIALLVVLSPVILGIYIHSKRGSIKNALAIAANKTKNVMVKTFNKMKKAMVGSCGKIKEIMRSLDKNIKTAGGKVKGAMILLARKVKKKMIKTFNKMKIVMISLGKKIKKVALNPQDVVVNLIKDLRHKSLTFCVKHKINVFREKDVKVQPLNKRKVSNSDIVIKYLPNNEYRRGTVVAAGMQNEKKSNKELLDIAKHNEQKQVSA